MSTFDEHGNFAYSIVAIAPTPAAGGTSLGVFAGDGTLFPTPPFNVTIWPADTAYPTATDAEILRVTAIVGDTFTVTRQQEGSPARTILVGDQIAETITAKSLTDIETEFDAHAASASAHHAQSHDLDSHSDKQIDSLNIGTATGAATGDIKTSGIASSIGQEAWTEVSSFLNSWANYDSVNWETAAYFKDSFGIVHLKGLIKNGTLNASAFTLPAGYRPAKSEMFRTISNGSGVDRIDISLAGAVDMLVSANVYVTLSGITFRAA